MIIHKVIFWTLFLTCIQQDGTFCSALSVLSPIHGKFNIIIKNEIQGTFILDLIGGSGLFINYAYQWTIHGKSNPSLSEVYACSSILTLGQPGLLNNNGYFERVYSQLPPHSFLYYHFALDIIDNWGTSDYYEIVINDRPFFRGYPENKRSLYGVYSCGNPTQKDLLDVTFGRIAHSGPTLNLKIISTSATPGLRLLSILMSNSTSVSEFKCSSGSTGTDECACVSQGYQNPANPTQCLPCHSSCLYCFGPSDTECYYCMEIFDGIRCRGSPAPNCYLFDFLANRCNLCSSTSYFLYWDGVCRATCSSPPYIVETIGGYSSCLTPCQANNTFMLWSNTCVDKCDFPLIKRIEGDGMFCDYPCPSPITDYLYSNGSCISSCSFLHRMFEGRKFCDSCPGNSFIYPNQSCLPVCFSPRFSIGKDGYNYCVSPCKDKVEFYYKKESICKAGCGYPNRIDDSIFCVIDLSEDEKAALRTLSTVLESIGHARNVTVIIARLISVTNPSAVLLGSLNDIIMFIKYLKISYPPKLQFLLDQPQSEGIFQRLLAIPAVIENCFVKQDLPEKFQNYEINSSFFVNFWQPYLTLLIIGSGIIMIYLTICCTKKFERFNSLLLGRKQTLQWNLMISICVGYFGDVGFYTYMEISTVKFESFWSILSFVVGIITNVLALALFFKMLIILKGIINAKTKGSNRIISRRVNEIKRKWKEYEVIFEGFKDDSLLHLAFFPFFMLRLYIFNIIITSLFNYPLIQAILLTILSFVVLLYLITVRPFREKKNLIENLIQESAIMIINICVLILAFFDANDMEAIDVRETLGDIIIGVNTGFSMIGTLYLNIQILMNLKRLCFSFKRKTSSAIKEVIKFDEPKDERISTNNHSIQTTLDQFTSARPNNHPTLLKPRNLELSTNELTVTTDLGSSEINSSLHKITRYTNSSSKKPLRFRSRQDSKNQNNFNKEL